MERMMTNSQIMPVSSRRNLLVMLPAALATGASAQEVRPFPNRPLVFVVPYSAGSSTDLVARLVAPHLSAELGQPVVVENRPGAGGTIGMGSVARAQPDGYTLVMTSASAGPVNRALYQRLSFDPVSDLSLVYLTNMSTNALIVSGSTNIRTLQDFIDLSRSRSSNPLRYFSPGNGTSQHLSAVLLGNLAKIQIEHIPFRGPAEGLTALLAGDVDFGFASLSSITALLQDGRVWALGVTGGNVAPTLPEVPTLASRGLRDFADVIIWTGVATGRGVQLLLHLSRNAAARAALAKPELLARMSQLGVDLVPYMSLAEAEGFMQQQTALWAKLVRESGASVD
jgi:tripartite-type tricarboxylate transporter receptor subunit TctC